MKSGVVLVVGETPSLGLALVDLLEADGVPAELCSTVPARPPGGADGNRPAVIVVASNAPTSASARRWLDGDLGSSRLVMVGSRDPLVVRAPGIVRISLPIRPSSFLRTVRALLAGAEPPAD